MLPAGVYELKAYSEGPDAEIDVAKQTPDVLFGDIRVKIDGTTQQLDLGTIELVRTQ